MPPPCRSPCWSGPRQRQTHDSWYTGGGLAVDTGWISACIFIFMLVQYQLETAGKRWGEDSNHFIIHPPSSSFYFWNSLPNYVLYECNITLLEPYEHFWTKYHIVTWQVCDQRKVAWSGFDLFFFWKKDENGNRNGNRHSPATLTLSHFPTCSLFSTWWSCLTLFNRLQH